LQQSLDLNGQHRRIFEMRALFLPRLLKWDDRNFMAFSVESRYPFLDHELIDLCLSFSAADSLSTRLDEISACDLGLRSHLPPAGAGPAFEVRVRDASGQVAARTAASHAGALASEHAADLGSRRSECGAAAGRRRLASRREARRTWSGPVRLFVFDRWLTVCGVRT
jgi:asparagine synthetase B (glutamine-hydrolysing)